MVSNEEYHYSQDNHSTRSPHIGEFPGDSIFRKALHKR